MNKPTTSPAETAGLCWPEQEAFRQWKAEHFPDLEMSNAQVVALLNGVTAHRLEVQAELSTVRASLRDLVNAEPPPGKAPGCMNSPCAMGATGLLHCRHCGSYAVRRMEHAAMKSAAALLLKQSHERLPLNV